MSFHSPSSRNDLQTIYNNYNRVLETIEKLQKPSMSLVESLQILDTVYTQLNYLRDSKNNSVIAKFISVLEKDSGFPTLRQIYSDSASTHSLSGLKDYFMYANITSLDVERSFSSYKNMFFRNKCGVSDAAKIFNQSHSVCDNTDHAVKKVEMANILAAFFWLIIFVILSFPIAYICCPWYILFYTLSQMCPVFEGLSEQCLKGIQFPGYCVRKILAWEW